MTATAALNARTTTAEHELAALQREHGRPLFALLLRLCDGDRQRAEDLVQETLVRVAGAWRRVHREGNPAGYATTVMFRTHVSLWRRRRARVATVELAVDPPADSDGFAAVDARLTLRRALRALPPLQQAVLVATYLRDSPDDEIAELVGRSAATVRSLRHRGLKALAAALGTDDELAVGAALAPPASTASAAPPASAAFAGTAAPAPEAALMARGIGAPGGSGAVVAPPLNVPATRPDSGAGEEVPRGES